jgi:hypothetical protein
MSALKERLMLRTYLSYLGNLETECPYESVDQWAYGFR